MKPGGVVRPIDAPPVFDSEIPLKNEMKAETAFELPISEKSHARLFQSLLNGLVADCD